MGWLRARRRDEGGDAAAAADVVLRLAVLLQAGVAPRAAWGHLADTGDGIAVRVREAADAGMPLEAAIAEAGSSGTAAQSSWPAVGAAWCVAATVGAPLAETLRGLASALRDSHEAADEVRIALAEPAGTARLMSWLPLVAIGLGLVLGFDTFGVLVGTPLGIACLVGGALLAAAARRWSDVLVARAKAAAVVPGMEADLLAIALSGGVSIERAQAIVAAATGADHAVATPEATPETAAVLQLSGSAGVPAVELLRASAALARHRARVDGRLRAAHLSSRLLLPLGVCTLPAFLLLGVAPMLLSIFSTMPLQL